MEQKDWVWLSEVTGNKIAVPPTAAPPNETSGELTARLAKDALMNQKRALLAVQGEEAKRDRALKDTLLKKAVDRLEKFKDPLREASQMTVIVQGKLKQSKLSTAGDQRDAFDTVGNAGRMVGVKGVDKLGGSKPLALGAGTLPDKAALAQMPENEGQKAPKLVNIMGELTGEANKLEAVLVDRSEWDAEMQRVVVRKTPLFTVDEVADELFTPMVREGLVSDNFVADKYSRTQKMITGSDEYYIKECKAKGGSIGPGVASVAKSTVSLASTLTQVVLGALAPVASASALGTFGNVTQHPLDHAGSLSSDQASQDTVIVQGVAALLGAGIDVVDKGVQHWRLGNLSAGDFKAVANEVGLGIGREVAGWSGNENLGFAITDAVSAAAAGVDIVGAINKWQKGHKLTDLPWTSLCGELGAAIGKSVGEVAGNAASVGSDETSDQLSTDLAILSKAVPVAFDALAGLEKRATKLAQAGSFRELAQMIGKEGGDLLVQTARDSLAVLPTAAHDAAYYNDQTDFAKQEGATAKSVADSAAVTPTEQGLETLAESALNRGKSVAASATAKITTKVTGRSHVPFDAPAKAGKFRAETLDEAFAKKRKELGKQNADEQSDGAKQDELSKLLEENEKERAEFSTSLVCLGSMEEKDYKSVAKLIKTIERDQAIWAAIVAVASGGAAVAAQFVTGLKAAGEAAKFAANTKAAVERGIALHHWRMAMKDAERSNSPYESAVANMLRNSATQLTSYTIAAGANLVKTILGACEMSPYAPAFKIAGASVGMAATAADMIFKMADQAVVLVAWRATKQAFANPRDRKAALYARSLNPTLAKYTLAYGAYVEGDETIIRLFNSFGLDRESLARAGDGVKEIKDYLQTKFKDDKIILGQLPLKTGEIEVPPVELVPQAWATTQMLILEDSQLRVEAPSPTIMSALKIASSFAEKPLNQLSVKDRQAYRAALVVLAREFDAAIRAAPVEALRIAAAGYAEEVAGTLAVVDQPNASPAPAIPAIAG